MKFFLFGLLGITVSILLTVGVGEIAIRGYLHFIYGQRYTQLDRDLGWKTTGNYYFQGTKTDYKNEKHEINVSTNAFGFRQFGDTSSGRSKILIIGDSFTHAIDVSDGATYYSRLGEILDAEIFAYGAGGYGTLQQRMILEKYYDLIQPDVVILQYCSNDFINNHFPLERQSYGNNNGKMRPYLTTEGKIIQRLPAAFPGFRNFSNHHSMFLYFIISRIDKLTARYKGGESIEYVIEENPSLPLFRESVAITSRLLADIRKSVPESVPIFTFGSDNNEPFYAAFRELAEKNGFMFIDGIPQAVIKAEESGTLVRFDGSHWNERGHVIVAEELGKYLKKKVTN